MLLLDILHRARGHPFRRQQLHEDHHATSYMLREVQDALHTVGADWILAHFGLPLPYDILPALEQQNEIETLKHERNSGKEGVQTSLQLLNTNQHQAFDEIVGAMMPGVFVSSLLEGT